MQQNAFNSKKRNVLKKLINKSQILFLVWQCDKFYNLYIYIYLKYSFD